VSGAVALPQLRKKESNGEVEVLMGKHRKNEVERMPGSDSGANEGLTDYLILLKDEDSDEGGGDAFYQAGLARNAAFQERLRDFLQRKEVADQVATVWPPTVFPVVAIRATPQVAKLLKELPEVEDVVRDTDGISLPSSPRHSS
jgi:hypothetical protein